MVINLIITNAAMLFSGGRDIISLNMRNLGVVFSGRLQSFFLWLLGLWIIMFMSTLGWQAVSSYISGDGFDVSTGQFWITTVFLFAPYLLVAGYMLRSLAARIAFYRLLRKQIVIAEYQPPKVLLPVEAGVLADDDFSLNELAATLKDLELRGNIGIKEEGHELGLTLHNKHGLSAPETVFLNSLFSRHHHFSTAEAYAARHMLSCGQALASATRADLAYNGLINKNPAPNKVLRDAFKIFVGFAALIQILLTVGVVTAPEEIFNVVYPRYPMDISQPLLILGVIVATIALVLSGFWMRKLTGGHGLKNWRYVAGLKLYLDKVYKGRFYREGRLMVSERELRNFYPYALALGVEQDFTRKLERSLFL